MASFRGKSLHIEKDENHIIEMEMTESQSTVLQALDRKEGQPILYHNHQTLHGKGFFPAYVVKYRSTRHMSSAVQIHQNL